MSPNAHAMDARHAPPPALLRAPIIGIDVGSTTVKAVVIDSMTHTILWQDYRRHESKQPETVLDFLERIERDNPGAAGRFRAFITGSGGATIARHIGATFVQEVNAVAVAVERLYPDTGSVIELGGQDAKIIVWVEDPGTRRKRKLLSMNDRCAGGTGAVIDKITAKLGLTTEALCAVDYYGVKLHPVAGKCGVFAETDINSLQKQGIPAPQLMASLFDAVVQQNLSVLTRGNTLRPKVLLLGGPNAFIPALQDAWRDNVVRLWAAREVALPDGLTPESLIHVPENAVYFAALGAALYGTNEEPDVGRYHGTSALAAHVATGRIRIRDAAGTASLAGTEAELAAFTQRFARQPFQPARFVAGQMVEVYVGIDAGSTSTKGVLIDAEHRLLAKAYQLSRGSPVEDVQEILASLHRQVSGQGATLNVMGLSITGYAKDLLKDVIGADVALVETVAHTRSALHYYGDVDVVVDVGGQDIKVIMLADGRVKEFRLNTQCSAGNGYFLQATAAKFGYDVSAYAAAAFSARRMPALSYGCAVFLESDTVNLQQLGWSCEEILAGLAAVLPKNIWLYVVQEPNPAKLGRRFVLQGGTQYNLAAVKAQYDFIMAKVPNAEVFVHEHCGECGALGAALEAARHPRTGPSRFIGFEAAASIVHTATRDESTRCRFCKNHCLRTFIDTHTHDTRHRFIVATCEKGAVDDVNDLRSVKSRIDAVREKNPNFVEIAAAAAFKPQSAARAPSPQPTVAARLSPWLRRRRETEHRDVEEKRAQTKIGMPRVLNMYSEAPFFIAYFESLGIPDTNIIFSQVNDEQLWNDGSRRGSIDPCFPSKVALSHVHSLLFGARHTPDVIFFPALGTLPTELRNTLDSAACPTVTATPQVVRAAFTKERDMFADNGVIYCNPVLNMAEPRLLERQLLTCFGPLLWVRAEENTFATDRGYQARERFAAMLRSRAREELDRIEAEHRVGLVILGRPYHHDSGINHGILEQVQRGGYPIFSIDSLPTDPDMLVRLFGDEVTRGDIGNPFDITDVWKNAYSENTNRKIWAAKYVARHPNLVAIDLSSFKCGHDAPIYSVIEEIFAASGTPYFTFHDIDENKPSGSITVRIETIRYFLQQYEARLRRAARLEERIRHALRIQAEWLRAGARTVTWSEPLAARRLAAPQLRSAAAGASSGGRHREAAHAR
jgi:predicted CoA-substrate-specific enzyme activase